MDPEQRLAEALRAKAAGGAWPGPGPDEPVAPDQPAGWLRRETIVALAVALVIGVLLGFTLAVASVLFPGLLPQVG